MEMFPKIKELKLFICLFVLLYFFCWCAKYVPNLLLKVSYFYPLCKECNDHPGQARFEKKYSIGVHRGWLCPIKVLIELFGKFRTFLLLSTSQEMQKSLIFGTYLKHSLFFFQGHLVYVQRVIVSLGFASCFRLIFNNVNFTHVYPPQPRLHNAATLRLTSRSAKIWESIGSAWIVANRDLNRAICKLRT